MKSVHQSHQGLRDVLSLLLFVLTVFVGAWLINLVIFRSFNVSGPSMEPTLYTNDRLIVNRMPVAWSYLSQHQYVPTRGHVIVFKNPRFNVDMRDEYIVKRVIAFAGEHVSVKNGLVRVTNKEYPNGFDPYSSAEGIVKTPVSGISETDVPAGEIYVIGDHRDGEFSMDSRNGLGTIPLEDVIGPVAFRVYPFDKVRTF